MIEVDVSFAPTEVHLPHGLRTVLETARKGSQCLLTDFLSNQTRKSEIDENVLSEGGTEHHVLGLDVQVHEPHAVQQQQRLVNGVLDPVEVLHADELALLLSEEGSLASGDDVIPVDAFYLRSHLQNTANESHEVFLTHFFQIDFLLLDFQLQTLYHENVVLEIGGLENGAETAFVMCLQFLLENPVADVRHDHVHMCLQVSVMQLQIK